MTWHSIARCKERGREGEEILELSRVGSVTGKKGRRLESVREV
jgi:hypothetical protein